jgi:hypothetical protein
MVDYRIGIRIAATLLAVALWPHGIRAALPESQRLERAKDLIADEEWVRAIEELKGAAEDPKEESKDEALFWLAHSHYQARDTAAAIETIRRLERQHPKSAWVRPARSLRIEIAQRLHRNDVLWYTAAPPPPALPGVLPSPGAPSVSPPPAPPPAPRGRPRTPPHDAVRPPARPPATIVAPEAMPAGPAERPLPPPLWVPEGYLPDTDLRIQALGSLIHTDTSKVVPILKDIALSGENGGEARRALFVLAQSRRPEARSTVVEVAKTGPEAIRLVAVRELGRLGDPAVWSDLLEVYSSGTARVKHQVVTSMRQRGAASALLRIIQSERDRRLRDVAIMTLGEAGGRDDLARLYPKAGADAKRAIISGLFNARAEDELIGIARRERDPQMRQHVLSRLRLLGTPTAKLYLEQEGRKRKD